MRVTNPLEDEGESFISHLIELRTRLVRSALAVVAVFLCLFPFASQIYDLLAEPMMHALPAGSHMIATGVVTPFMVPLKVTLMVAFVIALPIVLYQAWSFVAPGLYTHEKKLAFPLIVSSYLLFLTGIAFCYEFVFRTVFSFINQHAPASVSVAPDIESYLSFVLTMFLAFGTTFEVPIVVVVLVRFGIVTVATLSSWRPYIVVGAFAIAAVVTPPDAVSMLLLAFPLWFLFEAGLFAARFITPRPPSEKPASAKP